VSQRRGIMILMYAAAPYFLDRLLAHVETRAKCGGCSPELARFSAFIPVLRNAVVVIRRCHLAVFYLHGIFYHISKRLSGTRYVSWWLCCICPYCFDVIDCVSRRLFGIYKINL